MNNYFFEYYHNETKQSIEKNFAELTQLEKSIGEFFITNKAIRNFSSKKYRGFYMFQKPPFTDLQKNVDIKVTENLFILMKRILKTRKIMKSMKNR